MEHIEQAGVHSGDSACSLPPYSLSSEMQDELRRQTELMAKALNVVRPDERAVRHPRTTIVYVLEVNPRASRTVPFVSKATGLPLAKIAARCMAGRSLKAAGRHRRSHPAVFLGQGSGVPVHQVPRRRHHSRPGNEVHRRSDGRRRDLRRSLCQERSWRPASSCRRSGKVFLSREGQRQGQGRRGGPPSARAGLPPGGHARHGACHRGGRRAGDSRSTR